jgi:rare lipoprotein A
MRSAPFLFVLLLGIISTGCTEMRVATHVFKKATNPAPYSAPPIRGKRKVGNPYVISGKTYYPIASSEGYRAKGIASWYGKDFHNKKTANGERYNMFAMTAAHPTLPLPTYVRVTNLENGASIMVRVNDRGPFKRGRLIDLSYKAANLLGMAEQGTAPVLVEALPTDGSPLRPATWGTRVTSSEPVSKKKIAHPTTTSFTRRVSGQQDTETGQPLPGYQMKTKHALKNVDVYIQTGAFGDVNNAIRQRKKLETIYLDDYPIQLMEIQRAGRTLHRVRVGPIETIDEADELLLKVLKHGFNTAIIAVD